MIVEEKISGTLCRLHPDEKDPKYVAQWILSKDGEIKALMVAEGVGLQAFKEFGAWVLRQKRTLKLTTAIVSIAKIAKYRWGFIEMERKDKCQ